MDVGILTVGRLTDRLPTYGLKALMVMLRTLNPESRVRVPINPLYVERRVIMDIGETIREVVFEPVEAPVEIPVESPVKEDEKETVDA